MSRLVFILFGNRYAGKTYFLKKLMNELGIFSKKTRDVPSSTLNTFSLYYNNRDIEFVVTPGDYKDLIREIKEYVKQIPGNIFYVLFISIDKKLEDKNKSEVIPQKEIVERVKVYYNSVSGDFGTPKILIINKFDLKYDLENKDWYWLAKNENKLLSKVRKEFPEGLIIPWSVKVWGAKRLLEEMVIGTYV